MPNINLSKKHNLLCGLVQIKIIYFGNAKIL